MPLYPLQRRILHADLDDVATTSRHTAIEDLEGDWPIIALDGSVSTVQEAWRTTVPGDRFVAGTGIRVEAGGTFTNVGTADRFAAFSLRRPGYGELVQFGGIYLSRVSFAQSFHATFDIWRAVLAGDDRIKMKGTFVYEPLPPALSNGVPAIQEWDFYSHPLTNLQWVNMPATATQFSASTNAERPIELSHARRARLVTQQSIAGAAGSELRAQYWDGATWQYLDHAAGPAVSAATTGGQAGTWINLDYQARGSRVVRIIGINGDGVADPAWRYIALEIESVWLSHHGMQANVDNSDLAANLFTDFTEPWDLTLGCWFSAVDAGTSMRLYHATAQYLQAAP